MMNRYFLPVGLLDQVVVCLLGGICETILCVGSERRDDVIRIISARKATKQEVKQYVESIEN
jgi:uncharacterized DUF497 family protein